MAATEEQIRATAETYIAGLNASDPEVLAGVYADDATVEDPVGGGTVHEGKDAIRAFYDNLAPLQMEATLLEARVCGSELLFNFELVTRFDENTATTINVWDLMVHGENGKVTSMKAYWGPENVS